jgi:hypothetical protein
MARMRMLHAQDFANVLHRHFCTRWFHFAVYLCCRRLPFFMTRCSVDMRGYMAAAYCVYGRAARRATLFYWLRVNNAAAVYHRLTFLPTYFHRYGGRCAPVCAARWLQRC